MMYLRLPCVEVRCEVGEFLCTSSSYCVSDLFVCDGDRDCPLVTVMSAGVEVQRGGEDEQACPAGDLLNLMFFKI